MAPRALMDVLDSALGRVHRDDPTLAGTGGPAGNAQFTAWTGLLLLPLIVAELVTLLSVRQLISWHIAIGVLLIPPALLKTATTGWRIARYYTKSPPYLQAGPPPLLLRLLGPLVVGTTLALLGSGVSLIVIGPKASFTSLVTVAGQPITVLTLHQGLTIAWVVATGLHVLARLIPATHLALPFQPGRVQPAGVLARSIVVLATLAIGAILAAIVLGLSSSWTTADPQGFHHDDATSPGSSGPRSAALVTRLGSRPPSVSGARPWPDS